MTTHQIFSDNGDLYEVILRFHTIYRITRYSSNTQYRKELSYDDCPLEIQDQILQKAVENYHNDANDS